MNKLGLKNLPTTILALAAGFFVFPFWSLSFFNPFEVYLRTGSWTEVVSCVVPYWIGPLVIVFLALKRSLLVLPVFLLECGALFAQTLVSPIALSPYMQFIRIFLLIALLGIGFLLLSREMVFPLLSKNGRRWRSDVRFFFNHRAILESIGGKVWHARAMIENASRKGLLVSAPATEFEELIASIKPNDPVSLNVKTGNNSLKLTGIIVWYEATGPIIRFGIESSEPVPLEILIKRSRKKTDKFLPRFIEDLRIRFYTGSKLLAVSAWSIVIGGTLAIPNCGTEEDSGVARVGDAPTEGISNVSLTWDRNGFDDAFQLAASSSFQLLSIVDGCKSGFTARIDWSEQTKSALPLIIGDNECRIRIQEIRLGLEVFLYTGTSYNFNEGGDNKFASSKGNGLSVVNKKILPKIINKDIDLQYAISSTEVTAPIVVKVELPQEACKIELAEGSSPIDKKVEFKVRVHPAYLPYASQLTFLPCGEFQQWGECRPKEIKKVQFLNSFEKRHDRKLAPYMVVAVLDIKNPAIRANVITEGKSLRCREYFYLPR